MSNVLKVSSPRRLSIPSPRRRATLENGDEILTPSRTSGSLGISTEAQTPSGQPIRTRVTAYNPPQNIDDVHVIYDSISPEDFQNITVLHKLLVDYNNGVEQNPDAHQQAKNLIREYPKLLADSVLYHYFADQTLAEKRAEFGYGNEAYKRYVFLHNAEYGILSLYNLLNVINFILNNPVLYPQSFPVVIKGIKNYLNFTKDIYTGDWRHSLGPLVILQSIKIPEVEKGKKYYKSVETKNYKTFMSPYYPA